LVSIRVQKVRQAQQTQIKRASRVPAPSVLLITAALAVLDQETFGVRAALVARQQSSQ